jgi:glycosyltransferase involved in cell wall biosynthesis
MRILVLCHEFPPIGGGAAAVCAALSRQYSTSGHEVVVASMGFAGLPDREEVDGCEVHRIACGRRRKTMASPLEGLRWARAALGRVRRLHGRRPFDVTHAHFIMPAGIVAAGLKRSAGVPFAVTAHGSDVPGFNRERLRLAHRLVAPWWRRLCGEADRIISPSRSLMHLIEAAAPIRRGMVLPNGFEPGRFKPLAKERRILLCSRLVERKGFQYFLEAIREVPLPGWEVDVVGSGPQQEDLSALAARCEVPVHMRGWIDNDDPLLAELYGRAMVFVFPSEWENFSIALLEAMSAGCAIITTDVSGNPEAIGSCGELVPPRDVDALRRAVVALTADPERCRRLGESAARRVVKEFDWKLIGERYLEVLAGLVGPEEPVPCESA